MFFRVSQYDRLLQSTWNVERYQLIGRLSLASFSKTSAANTAAVRALIIIDLNSRCSVISVVLEAVDFVLQLVDLLS